jgi:hypothetical protein
MGDFAGKVLAVLRVNGRLPRRAVLLPCGLGERAAHPELPEVDILSRLCEIARPAAGQPVHPRRTAELLDLALGGNSPGAWEAAKDDLVTGDLDLDGATALLGQPGNPAALVACLVGARDGTHFVHVCIVLTRILRRLPEESRAEMGRALACQLRSVMDCLAGHGAFLNRDVRDAILGGFGRLLAAAGGAPDALVAEMIQHSLLQKRDELVRLFLHVPCTFLSHAPHLAAELLDRARGAPSAQARYPLLALLARLAAARPDLVVAGREREVAEVAGLALSSDEGELDARTCLAAAALASAAGGCGNPLAASLARALRSCAASLVSANADENFSL